MGIRILFRICSGLSQLAKTHFTEMLKRSAVLLNNAAAGILLPVK
jgi:hypothetical protein